jgi:hypothetical protein
MKFNNLLKPQFLEDDLKKVEDTLQKTLVQVSPRQEFVSDLFPQLLKSVQRSTSREGSITFQDNQKRKLDYILLTIAGIISSTMIIFAGIRVVIAILGMLGILHQVNKEINTKSENSSLQPAT